LAASTDSIRRYGSPRQALLEELLDVAAIRWHSQEAVGKFSFKVI
jgi:hypothetical protein